MLEAKDISVGYADRTVLDAVSLRLEPETIVALLGANGAGKTTLIKALNGTVAVRSGSILLDGKPLRSLARREIARRVAVVAQENETRFPITVREFVLAGRFANGSPFGWESPADGAAAELAIRECQLDGFDHRLMNELSGGERQRVVLARALATGAKMLLLDEPAANLDLAHQASMFRLVRDKCRNDGYAAVVITHDPNLAAEFADKVMLLRSGQVHSMGTPDEVLRASGIREVFNVNVLIDENPASGRVRVTTVY